LNQRCVKTRWLPNVQAHLEPPGPPVAARSEEDRDHPDDAERARINQIVIRRTGRPPSELRLLHSMGGLVAVVTVAVPPDTSLPRAHDLASRFEDSIRDRQPHVDDVVVHTEP
jgi:divalent metal cation (Fe/Co/Zn/Cd) transporter